MTYIEGFVIPVPTANKQKFVTHANHTNVAFIEHGAVRVVECWQDKIEKGHTTDFFGAVDATEDEAVAFSWVEWPSSAERDAMNAQMDELMKSDDRFDHTKNPMPFDGARMIFGTFQPLVDEGDHQDGSYVQGFLVPVPAGNKDAYRTAALAMWEIMKDYGAVRVIEAWQDDVPKGKQTDFFRAVKAEDGEIVVFSFVEWTSREACQSAHDNMMQDERMKSFMGANPDAKPPFDGKRMVWGGFMPVVDVARETAGA
jgi:uncharacterized protein YbaA (DUF1428 family)